MMTVSPMAKRIGVLLLLLVAAAAILVVSEGLSDRAGVSPGSAPGAVGFSPPPSVSQMSVAVTLRPGDPPSRVVYTTDGSLPSAEVGSLYERPIRLDASVPGVRILRAAEVVGGAAGPTVSASYVVGLAPALPVVSLIAEPADLWGEERGLFANPSWRGPEWERAMHVTGFFGADTTVALPAGLRIDGREPLNAPKQTLRVYFRSEYGAPRLQMSLFPDHPYQAPMTQSYKRLLLQAGIHGVTWSLLRDQVVTTVARDLGLPAAQGRFVWLFVNGSSWGICRLTERVDRFLIADNFGIRAADVVQEGDARDGTDVDWHTLIDWVGATDLRGPDAYEALAARIDIANLIDFAILWQYFGFPADALVSIQPQGGRWFWIYEGGASDAGAASDFAVLHGASIANEVYRSRFVSRLADLLNTALAPSSIERYVGAFPAELAEDFAQERGRWVGVPSWEQEVEALRTHAGTKHEALAEAAGLTVSLRLARPPEGYGRLYVNGAPISAGEGMWEGRYAPGTEIEVVAVPAPGYDFVAWRGPSPALSAPEPLLVLRATSPLTLTAGFAPTTAAAPRPDDVLINELWINDDGTRYGSLGHAALEGDWIELLVRAPGGADLRGWWLTDRDTPAAETEGAIILPQDDRLASVPCGTVILIVASVSPVNAASFPADDLDPRDGVMILYVGNGALDAQTVPGFSIGTGNDNLVLLAPGRSTDDAAGVGIDFVAEGLEATPGTFGVLADGVTFDSPFSHLGADDGAVFSGLEGNDDLQDWLVDPSACASEDAQCYGATTLVSPGALNAGQRGYRLRCLVRRLRLP